MKVKFSVRLRDRTVEEIVEIDESKVKMDGYGARNNMNNILDNWVYNQLYTYYQIIDDERFDDGLDNIPYVDWVTKKRLGW